jgi:23S rRNA (cytidine1920-2'-O)/16S rRNA (cytidine1409-2'-O)-methyltransferase
LRLDQYLVEKGLAPTREKAQALIMSGLVLVDGKTADKPGQRVKENAKVEIKEPFRYVSRGGYKLEHALEKLGLFSGRFYCFGCGFIYGRLYRLSFTKGCKKGLCGRCRKSSDGPKTKAGPKGCPL